MQSQPVVAPDVPPLPKSGAFPKLYCPYCFDYSNNKKNTELQYISSLFTCPCCGASYSPIHLAKDWQTACEEEITEKQELAKELEELKRSIKRLLN